MRFRTSLIVASLAAVAIVAATLGMANLEFLRHDLDALSGVSPKLLHAGLLFVSFIGTLGLVSALYFSRGLRFFSPSGDGTNASFVIAWLGLWLCSMFVGSHLQAARISAELGEYGVVAEAQVAERRMERRGRYRRELRVYYRYATAQGVVDESEWEREAQTDGREIIRVRYSARYPHINRVE